MLEFDSISVSSYEADTLANKLTEKSAAGWDVVSIVSAGSAVTAYLSRAATGRTDSSAGIDTAAGGEAVGPLGDADLAGTSAAAGAVGAGAGSDAPSAAEWSSTDTPFTPSTPEPASVDDTPAMPDTPSIDTPSTPSVPSAPGIDTPSTPSVPSAPGIDTPSTPSVPDAPGGDAIRPTLADDVAALTSQIEREETPSSADESGGWGASTEAASIAEPSLPGSAGAAQQESSQQEPAQQETAQQEPAQQAAAATAPAGWYADPSGRFELRYWDGNQWTEHVSRAGQQYTDPPVA